MYSNEHAPDCVQKPTERQHYSNTLTCLLRLINILNPLNERKLRKLLLRRRDRRLPSNRQHHLLFLTQIRRVHINKLPTKLPIPARIELIPNSFPNSNTNILRFALVNKL